MRVSEASPRCRRFASTSAALYRPKLRPPARLPVMRMHPWSTQGFPCTNALLRIHGLAFALSMLGIRILAHSAWETALLLPAGMG